MSPKIYKSYRLTPGVGLENLDSRVEVGTELAAQPLTSGLGLL